MQHLKRYFCEADKVYQIQKEYVFIEPGEYWEAHFLKPTEAIFPKPWDYYEFAKSIVLLGPPRQGKTTEFKHQCSKATNGFYLPLRKLPTRGSLRSFANVIEGQAIWGSWITSNDTGELFIDALDEGKISTPQMMTDLVAWILSLGPDIINRLKIHLSCRTADWSRLDKDEWHDLFSSTDNKDNVVVLELLDLDRKQYIEYCQSQGIDPFALLKNIPMRAKQFVARPLTLQMVVEDFRTTGQVPTDTKDLYDRAIERRLAEHNRAYQRQGAIPATAQRRIAEYYALLTILSDREIIAAQNIDPSLHISARITEDFDGNEETATFMSGLFRSDIHGQYRFDDLEIAEYLAACQMNRNINAGTITPKAALSLFIAQTGQKEPVPCLRGTMVWLCTMNPEFRQLTINLNPEVLLYDYPGEMPPGDKLRIWEWLKTKFADRVYFDDGAWYYGAGAIACPELILELTEALEYPDHYGRDLRILALRVASQGKLTQIIPVLEKCLQRTDDNPRFLRYAADALAELSPERVVVINNWLEFSPTEDPDNQLLGTALDALWQNKLLTIDELISHLRLGLTKLNGRYGNFLYYLPDRLTDDEKAIVIESMANELKRSIAENKKKNYVASHENPCKYIFNFLLPLITEWNQHPEHIPNLEKWYSTAAKARSKGIISLSDAGHKLIDFLDQNHKLRQLFCIQHIQRIFDQNTDTFTPRERSVYFAHQPNKYDLCFWMNILYRWLNKDSRLLEAAWHCFLTAWESANFRPYLANQFDNLTAQNPTIGRLWNEWRATELPPDEHNWHRRDVERKRRLDLEQQHELKMASDNIKLIKSGDLNALIHYYDIDDEYTEKLRNKYGDGVADAYENGLIKYWETAVLPELASYHTTNKMPWEPLLVLKAVATWQQQGTITWDQLPENMRLTALQAGMLNLNGFPEWYSNLVSVEADRFRDLASYALDLETEADGDYGRLAEKLAREPETPIYREIGLRFLENRPDARQQIAVPLIAVLSGNSEDPNITDFLDSYGKRRLSKGDKETGLNFLAAVWRYRPYDTWQWITTNFLSGVDDRPKRFELWINILNNFHCSSSDRWPAWVTPEALIDLLPDFYFYFPVSEDPTVDQFNHGGAEIKHRDHLARLRSDTISIVTNSGTPIARDLLLSMINNPEYRNSRDSLLIHLDRWERAQAEKSWSPLPPNELLEVLTEGKRPLRNHQELFELVLEIVGDIKAEMEGGQSNLKRLCWIHPTEKGVKPTPADETNLQIVLGREIANHPLRRNIIGNREVTVTGENHPDLKVEAILESGQPAIVYIEVKRQMHPEVLTALETQLTDKYLIVPEAKNGIYFVGWYGDSDEFWRASQTSRRNICGSLPITPHELEICLQSKASIIMDQRTDIDNIKAVVVDLSL